MSIRILLATILSATFAGHAYPQMAWPGKGKKAAIVLTYDDALRSQLDFAIPQLDAAGLTCCGGARRNAPAMKSAVMDYASERTR